MGVQMAKTAEGFIDMKQTGVIDHVLKALRLDSKLATSKGTPAKAKPLTKNENHEFWQGSFTYYSSSVYALEQMLHH